MKQTVTRFGRELRRFRTMRRLSQAEFGEKMGVDRSQISTWETTSKIPTPRLMERLRTAFGVNPFDWLATLEKNEEKGRYFVIEVKQVPEEEIEALIEKTQAHGGSHELAL